MIVSVNYKTLVFLNLETGEEIKVYKEAHKDIIKKVYVFKNQESFMTGSIDGTIVIRCIKDIEEKKAEIKTNRVVDMIVSNDE